MSEFVYFLYMYYMILAGFDPALGFYFFSLKITKQEGNNEIIVLIKSVQTDFPQTFSTTFPRSN